MDRAFKKKQALRRGVHTGGEKLRLLQQNAAALRPISQQKRVVFFHSGENFSLFPPGFPQCKCSRCIHGVILRQGAWDVLGEKEGVSPFIKKKVEAFSFHFTVRCGVPVFGSPIWNERGQSFQHRGGCKPRLWKMRGKAQFSTPPFPGAEKAEILPFSVRCARIRTAEIGRFTRRMGDFAA